MPRGNPAVKRKATMAATTRPKKKTSVRSTALEAQGRDADPPMTVSALSSAINYEELAKYIVREQDKVRASQSTDRTVTQATTNITTPNNGSDQATTQNTEGSQTSTNAVKEIDSSSVAQSNVASASNDQPSTSTKSTADNSDNVNTILDAIFMRGGPAVGTTSGGRSDTHTRLPPAHLTSEAQSLLSASLSPSTQSAYRRSWQLLQSFQANTTLPLQVTDVCNFIAHLHGSHFSASTISSHISALSYVHKLLGLPDPTQMFIVKKILRGCHKLSHTADSRLPITIGILGQIINALPNTVPVFDHHIMLKALFLLCFHAFLRMGEVTVKQGIAHNKVIQVQDVTFQYKGQNPCSVQLVLRHFKTQKMNEPIIICLESSPNSEICPVNALCVYQSQFSHISGPLFQFKDGTPLSYNYVSKQLAASVKFTGLNPALYKGHSFRIGAATYAAQKGYSENYIQQLGRWNSNALKRYIRIPAFSV
ncbi:integrase/recombinase xerD homolog [Saccostrea echinata]|uniref:integrase/recombinase xerD homolog n=1 Tax=Saccostrea echinata TaxID=191078 RepID=UPI002A7FC0C0|nr:integrase/recombinase xerD homolog [Saccostrea echinata]XP_061195018.1 integrase/recombinase xerD homolog [Saccostrea echinata]